MAKTKNEDPVTKKVRKKRKKITPAKKAKSSELKKKIGDRFKKFRKAINKPQHHLANELDVFQSTITNFELGKTYPNSGYLYHFYEKYGLNIHWLFTGQGNKFISELPENSDTSRVGESGLEYWGPVKYHDYMDLLKHMQIAEVEKIIFAKLTELKALYKNEIDAFDFEEFDFGGKDNEEK
ncbi:MAG: helix-turn-helix transcriptional regulator [Candidatus Aminicenantes bacterium]|nr:helix-turn-helix transcriptional regulator [Candidatus Aminicenantes bacterium]